MTKQLTAIIEREGNGYVSLCPEVDIADQGAPVDEAHKNLQEALELFWGPQGLLWKSGRIRLLPG